MKLWTDDGRTDDGRRTTEPAYTISSPGAFGSGELKSGRRNESMLPDRVLNPGPLTYESGALPIVLRGPAKQVCFNIDRQWHAYSCLSSHARFNKTTVPEVQNHNRHITSVCIVCCMLMLSCASLIRQKPPVTFRNTAIICYHLFKFGACQVQIS